MAIPEKKRKNFIADVGDIGLRTLLSDARLGDAREILARRTNIMFGSGTSRMPYSPIAAHPRTGEYYIPNDTLRAVLSGTYKTDERYFAKKALTTAVTSESSPPSSLKGQMGELYIDESYIGESGNVRTGLCDL